MGFVCSGVFLGFLFTIALFIAHFGILFPSSLYAFVLALIQLGWVKGLGCFGCSEEFLGGCFEFFAFVVMALVQCTSGSVLFSLSFSGVYFSCDPHFSVLAFQFWFYFWVC